MGWRVEHRTNTGADHVTAYWTDDVEIYDVAIVCGEGVSRTSSGGSSRPMLGPASQAVQGIFRWDPRAVTAPRAILRWRDDPDGRERAAAVPLGR